MAQKRIMAPALLAICTLLGATCTWAAETKPVLDPSSPCAPPEYPRASLANGEKGTVTLELVIGPDGKVADAKVEKSSGFRGLDRAAANAYSKCKFKPGTKDGKPDTAATTIQFNFSLD